MGHTASLQVTVFPLEPLKVLKKAIFMRSISLLQEQKGKGKKKKALQTILTFQLIFTMPF